MIGTFVLNDNPDFISIISNHLDFVIIDREHGSISFEKTNINLRFINNQCKKFIRVSSCNKIEIQRSLELDPDGILIPQIETENDIKNAIDYTFYNPIGNRGISPYTRPFNFHHKDSEKKKLEINKKLKLCILVEGKKILTNFEVTLKKYKKHIHMVYFGLYDFANSSNLKPDWNNNDLILEIKKIIRICKKYKIKTGTIARNKSEIKKLKKIKIDYIVYQNDTGIIKEAFEDLSQT